MYRSFEFDHCLEDGKTWTVIQIKGDQASMKISNIRVLDITGGENFPVDQKDMIAIVQEAYFKLQTIL